MKAVHSTRNNSFRQLVTTWLLYEHIVSLAPMELTWLSIQTQTTTLLPANQVSPCLRRGNKRPISCHGASRDKGRRTNQLSVWICWRNEQPLSCLSGLHGVTAWPMSGLSGCTEGVSVCRGPISGSVLPAGAGDWWLGAAAARQDRTVNPETVHTEAKRRHRWVRGCERGLAPAGDVLKWQRRDSCLGRTASCCVVFLPVDMLIDNRAALLSYLLMQADMLPTSSRRLELLINI